MKASKNLHRLIHSMTPTEKRQFKLFAAQHAKNNNNNNNNYIKIFDAVSAQDVWDEDKLRKRFSKYSFGRHLATTKYQLYHLILKSLSLGKNGRIEERELVDKAHILFNHGLYTQCAKMLEKARKNAEGNERFLELLEIVELQRKMFFILQSKDIEIRLAELLEYENDIIQKIANQSAYHHLYSRLVALEKTQHRIRNTLHNEKLTTLEINPLAQDPDKALSFGARRDYYRFQVERAVIKGNPDAAWEHQNRLLELWELNPSPRASRPQDYKRDLRNFLIICAKAERFDHAETVVMKIRALPSLSVGDEVDTARNLIQFQLFYYLQQGMFDQAMQAIPAMEQSLKKYAAKIPVETVLGIYNNIALLYFFHADYARVMSWVQKILENPGTDLRRDLQDFARLLMLVIHYELQNIDALESSLRSVRRYLSKRDILHNFEQTIIGLLQRLLNIRSQQEECVHFREALLRLNSIADKSNHNQVMGFTELLFWVESKAESVSLADLFQRKVVERNMGNE